MKRRVQEGLWLGVRGEELWKMERLERLARKIRRREVDK